MFKKCQALLPLLFLFVSPLSHAQLSFLGDDESTNKADGYEKKLVSGGLVKQKGVYYFTTPNGHLYQSSGTASDTKLVVDFAGLEGIFLAATNKYIYYATDDEYGKTVMQYDPVKNVSRWLYATEPYEKFSMNSVTVPRTLTRADEIFVHPDKSKVFFRTFRHDKFRISEIDDDTPDKVIIVQEGYMPTTEYPDVIIGVGAKLAFVRNEVFFNGRVKKASVGHYETSVTSVIPTTANPLTYTLKSDYRIEEKKIMIYEGFLNTGNAVYSLIKNNTDNGHGNHQLLKYDTLTAKTSLSGITLKADDYAAQVMDGEIYVSCKGYVGWWDEEEDEFNAILSDNKTTWGKVNESDRFLHVGTNLLCLTGSGFCVLNEWSDKPKPIHTPVILPEPNRYDVGPRYAYAGQKAFYFFEEVNGQPVFTQYDPDKDRYKPIVFPEFKKETFNSIGAVFQEDDRFLILAKYTGKKDKPIYKMFLYKEEQP